MYIKNSKNKWNLLPPIEWNRNIKNYIYSIPQYLPYNTTSKLQSYSVIQEILKNISNLYPCLYIIGSTWIHFGPSHLLLNISKQVYIKSGTLDWNDFGFFLNDTKNRTHDPYWKKVTETQLRLTHLLNNKTLNLIDIVNRFDYKKSFNRNDTSSLADDLNDKNLVFWLLRTCSFSPFRFECKNNNSFIINNYLKKITNDDNEIDNS
jgi:hypothetical protein